MQSNARERSSGVGGPIARAVDTSADNGIAGFAVCDINRLN